MDLPTEIWIQIFQISVDEYKQSVNDATAIRHYLRKVDHRAPLVLTRVSKRWRQIALNEPSLWSSIWILCHNRKRIFDPLQPPLNTIHAWIERSKCLPLSIFFDTYESPSAHTLDGRGPPLHKDTVECFQLLFSVIQRWKRVSLWLPKRTDLKADVWPKAIGGGAPLLESLEIPIAMDNLNDSNNTHISFLWTQSPKLRRLGYPMLHNAALDVDSLRSAQVPFSQLQHLSIHTLTSMDTVLSLLRLVANAIQHCFFGGITIRGQRPPVPPSSPYISCPHLRSLHLRLMVQGDTDRLMDILDYLTLPSLSDLTTTGGKASSSYKYEQFLHRSGCTVKKLFMSSQLRAEDLFTFLLSNPALASFRHSWHPMVYSARLFDALAEFDDVRGEFVLCPELREFGCSESCLENGAVVEAFLQFLEKRTGVGHAKGGLKELVIIGHRGTSSNLPLPLRRFAQRGLNIRYSLSFEEEKRKVLNW